LADRSGSREQTAESTNQHQCRRLQNPAARVLLQVW
jgi:hypothetical protein